MKLGNRKFHCWSRGGHGWVNLRKSVEQSCDVYYYEIATARRHREDRRDGAAVAGPRRRHPDMPCRGDPQFGLIPTKAWKRSRKEQDWLVGDTLNSGIGQGFVLATPLQLAVMTARMAIRSGDLQPRLIRAIAAGQPVPVPEAPGGPGAEPEPSCGMIRQRHVRRGQLVARGTAYKVRASRTTKTSGWPARPAPARFATSPKAERARGVIRNEDLPWHRRDHALFVGYAPADNPRYAVSVVVEHGGGGSKAAAPIAKDILELWLRDHYGTQPRRASSQEQGASCRTPRRGSEPT